MKRILVLENGPGFGGALVSLKHLVEAMPEEECEFHILTDYHQDYINVGNSVKAVHTLPRKRIYGTDKPLEQKLHKLRIKKAGNIAYAIDYLTTCRNYVKKVKKYIQKHDIELVHLNNWPLRNDAGLFAAKKAGVPAVMHVRGMEYTGRLVSYLLRCSDHVIAISQYIEELVLSMGISKEKTTVIPNAINFEHFFYSVDSSILRNEIGIRNDMPLIGIVGCLVDWKGHKIFIESIKNLLLDHYDCQAVIIGDSPNGKSNYKNELKNHVNQLGITNKVYFAGHRRDVGSAMASCDIIVHASTSPEPFGRVVIEGMALGKPVVATKEGGPGEIINNGVDGFLVPANDVESMAKKLKQLLDNHDLRERLKACAQNKVKKTYGIEHQVNSVLDCYNKILSIKQQ